MWFVYSLGDPMVNLDKNITIHISECMYGSLLEDGKLCSFQYNITGCWKIDENHYVLRGHRYQWYARSNSPYFPDEKTYYQEIASKEQTYYLMDLNAKSFQQIHFSSGLSERENMLKPFISKQMDKFNFLSEREYSRLEKEELIGWTLENGELHACPKATGSVLEF